MLIKWVIRYEDLFREVLVHITVLYTSDFCRNYQEVTYVGLVHYGFVTLHRNYSHLILEHVLYIMIWC